MVDPSAVESNLRNAGMRYVDSAKDDVVGALRIFKDLASTTEVFTFPNSSKSQLAFKLSGTIPIGYKGGRYHIPVALYLCSSHPYTGPFCFVRPTTDMKVKTSRVVDQAGRIYLPYLSDWSFPGYDLSGLLQVMTLTFQEQCPVFSSSSSRPAASGISSTCYPNASLANMPVPYQPFTGSSSDVAGSGNTSSSPYSTYQPPYPSYTNVPSLPTNQPSYSTQSSTGLVQTDHVKASVVSAIEYKVRERLCDRLGELLSNRIIISSSTGTYYAEMQSIRENLTDLRTGQQKLRAMLDQLERELKIMNTSMLAYKEKKIELEKVALECESGNDLETDIDAAIDALTPVHRQIMEAYGADCAIDDAIYALGQAVKDNQINVQIYLKHVRQLSRKQFVYRALIRKCRITARLPV